jgi:signal peptide peptidase SppA
MFPTLSVPTFPRLDEYAGLWAMEETRFLGLWQAAMLPGLIQHISAGPPPRPATQTTMAPAKNGKSVAVIQAAGTLMKQQPSMGGTSTVQLRRDVRSAANDPNVSAILMEFQDSPGGTVAGTSDLAADIKTARRMKPVWAQATDLTASAAYWLAASCDAIFANSPTALVGSIGTLMTVYDVSQAAERDGVKTLVFKTGPLKGLGTPGAPVTDEQAAHLQSLVNAMQTQFDAAVMKGRRMTGSQLAAAKTGGVFPAAEALDRKLIDGIRSFDQTLAELSAAR